MTPANSRRKQIQKFGTKLGYYTNFNHISELTLNIFFGKRWPSEDSDARPNVCTQTLCAQMKILPRALYGSLVSTGGETQSGGYWEIIGRAHLKVFFFKCSLGVLQLEFEAMGEGALTFFVKLQQEKVMACTLCVLWYSLDVDHAYSAVVKFSAFEMVIDSNHYASSFYPG